jgi:D-glucuronyl C5-epimerase C-terminus
VPGDGDTVGFANSQLDWEYYPGQGIEFQPLATFGKAQWWFAHGSQYYGKGRALMSELIPLASRRAGGLTWEYYFYFDGGVPPWTSAMSQGTALQALGDGYTAVRDRSDLSLGGSALPVFTMSPSRGVGVPTRIGIRYVQYTFDASRSDEIINAFLQAVIGLGTFAQASGNHLAQHLFNAGNAEAQAELPSFDTGSWSLYQPGVKDSLSYHQLVTGFLQKLCSMTHAQVYCTTAAHFQAYLNHPPPGV